MSENREDADAPTATGAGSPGEYAWKCLKCGETSDSPSMAFAVMHPTLLGDDHVVEPSDATTLRWSRALGAT